MRLSAAPTFRDLGGLVTRDGCRVQYGKVYRAGHLLDPGDIDLAFVRQLRLRRLFDLRSLAERHYQPSNWRLALATAAESSDVAAEAAVEDATVEADVRAGHDALLHCLATDQGVAGARQMMLQTYRGFPRAFAGRLRPLFDALCAADDLPLLVHCTAGKDRTGFACALLLHALGVGESAILADYLRVGDVLVHSPLADGLAEMLAGALGRPLEPAAIALIMSVRAEFLAAAFDAVRAEFGSLDAYLEQTAGVDAARCQQLRVALLQP